MTENKSWVYPIKIGTIFSITTLLYYEDEPRMKQNTYQESIFLKKKSYRMATGTQRGKRCFGYKDGQNDSFTI